MNDPRPRFLASVRDRHEARLAAALGADVIDLKEPRHGALGAVARDEQRAILAALGEQRPVVSATVGDLPRRPLPPPSAPPLPPASTSSSSASSRAEKRRRSGYAPSAAPCATRRPRWSPCCPRIA